jgi:(2Fe-2S) ferredoxin
VFCLTYAEGEGNTMTKEDLYYQHHVFCCNNERPADNPRGSCRAKGSEPLRNYMKARVKELGIASTRINVAGCLDRCELGCTMVIYPEGVWYTYGTKDDVEEIIERHLQKGEIVERLLLTKDQKELRDEQKQGRPPATAVC